MKSLLPYFEDELASLRDEAGAFAQQFPLVARSLGLSDRGSDDPHVDRLIQSAAWFSARVSKRLDDGYVGFAETLLDAIFPHYRRPFPSCAVARFAPASSPAEGEGTIARGTALLAGLPGVKPLRFRSVQSVDAADIDVSHLAFHQGGRFTTRDGRRYLGAYLDIRWTGAESDGFRVFADGEPIIAGALRDALGLGVTAVLRPDPKSDRHVILGGEVVVGGFDDDAAVLDDPAATNPGFSLLREWLARPETFGFFDFRWPDVGVSTGRVILMLDKNVVGDGYELRNLEAFHLLTRCGVVANVFEASKGVVGKAHHEATLDITPDDFGYTPGCLISIESVAAKSAGTNGPSVTIPHFHAARSYGDRRSGPFWVHASAADDPDAESLLFVDNAHEPTTLGLGANVSVRLLCCDGDRPRDIVSGTPMAQLFAKTDGTSPKGWLIGRPSAVSRFRLGKQATWRLVSHLAVGQLSLLGEDGGALRSLLELYMPENSAVGAQIVQAIVGVRHAPITRHLGNIPGLLARGTGIELRIDRTQLVGVGMHAMVHVLDRFFAQYAHVNSFTQLTLSSSHTGQEIYRCRMRTGNGPLI